MPNLKPPPGEPPNLTTALKYARRGFRIFPCNIDKRPLVEDWYNASSANADKITEWWNKNPEALIGLPCKHLDLLVIDCDRHTDDADGVALFDDMVAENGALPEHPIIETPNNGLHHIFRQPSLIKIGNRTVARGIDTRGYRLENDGGYIIGPGSVLPDGRGWKPAKGSLPFLGTVKKGLSGAPTWLVHRLREKEAPKAPAPISASPATSRETKYALAALDSIAHEVANTGQGERNNKLNAAAFRLGTMIARGWIGAFTVSGRLLDACSANGLLADDGHHAVNGTIKSGIEAGMKSPHPDLDDRPPPPKDSTKPQAATRDRIAQYHDKSSNFEQAGTVVHLHLRRWRRTRAAERGNHPAST